jgi:hypothetical protein
MGGGFRVHEGEASGEHPSHGVTHHGGFLHSKMLQETLGVGGVQVQAVGDDGFGGATPAQLVRHHHPEPGLPKGLHGFFPVHSVVAGPMEKDHSLAVGRSCRRHVHVRHPEILPKEAQTHGLHGIGIRYVLHIDGDGTPVFRWG